MSQIFISYAREDELRIQPLVHALESQGWSVFWDRRIPTGQTWRSYIGKALSDANCVIVAWSHHSIDSNWVSEEADEGKKRGILVPVLLDCVEPPIGFRSIQAADLSDWQSQHPSPHFEQLLQDIQSTIKTTSLPITEESVSTDVDTTNQPQLLQAKTNSAHRQSIYVLAFIIFIFLAGTGYLIYPGLFSPNDKSKSTANLAVVPQKKMNTHVYLHIANKDQYQKAEKIKQDLIQSGFSVEGIEDISGKADAPQKANVRYFYDEDEVSASTIVATLKANGIDNAYSSRLKIKSAKAGNLEVWFSAME